MSMSSLESFCWYIVSLVLVLLCLSTLYCKLLCIDVIILNVYGVPISMENYAEITYFQNRNEK